jgi:hypothetical protein
MPYGVVFASEGARLNAADARGMRPLFRCQTLVGPTPRATSTSEDQAVMLASAVSLVSLVLGSCTFTPIPRCFPSTTACVGPRSRNLAANHSCERCRSGEPCQLSWVLTTGAACRLTPAASHERTHDSVLSISTPFQTRNVVVFGDWDHALHGIATCDKRRPVVTARSAFGRCNSLRDRNQRCGRISEFCRTNTAARLLDTRELLMQWNTRRAWRAWREIAQVATLLTHGGEQVTSLRATRAERCTSAREAKTCVRQT